MTRRFTPESMLHLNQFAKLLKVHPRTIIRYMTRERNPRWCHSTNPKFTFDQIADAMRIEVERLILLTTGKDRILTEAEAREAVGNLIPDTFRSHKYPALIRTTRMTRYSYHDLMNYHIQRWVRDAA